MKAALEGVRVIDLTQVLAGPYCTMILGDMGADVVKVETRGRGDLGRNLGEVRYGLEVGSPIFRDLNRNKRSITLDLKKEEGKEVFRRMVARSDVVVENFRPDVMERLGLGYEALRAANPRLIYCGISGFGKDGPYSHRPAFDQIVQGMSGLMSITGDEQTGPLRVGTSITDNIGGVLAVVGILLALYARERRGCGQEVQVALLDGVISMLSWRASDFLSSGELPRLSGNHLLHHSPSGTFRARDGYINIAANHQHMWEAFCRVVGAEEWVRDPRFADNEARIAHRDALTALINARLQERDVEQWVDALCEAGVPSGPIYNLAQAFANPQLLHQGMVVDLLHPVAGHQPTVGVPIKLSETPGSIRSPAPVLGQHTAALLEEMGYEEKEIGELRDHGVI